MPVIGVDALEKISRNLDDGCDRHVSCAADQVSSELNNGGRAECASSGNEYMHPVSIEENTEHRCQIAWLGPRYRMQ